MGKRKTAGEQSLIAASDTTRYDPLEVGEALTNDILKNVWECIDAHHSKINELEFCIIMVRAKDPLIKGVMRKKFYAWPFLPKPRPEQLVFHYSKSTDDIKRLWSLPSAKVMAVVSEMTNIAPQWKQTKSWCDAFYSGFRYDKKKKAWVNHHPEHFYDFIRFSNNIFLESESEFLNTHRAELINAGCNEVKSNLADPFDFSKVAVHKVIDKNKPILD